mgnify:CR=1 FL=1
MCSSNCLSKQYALSRLFAKQYALSLLFAKLYDFFSVVQIKDKYYELFRGLGGEDGDDNAE